jgi:hypothetical protein
MARNNFLKDNQNLIIYGILIYVGYSKVIKPILDKVGITKSDEEILIEKEITKLDSPWNPKYYRQFGSRPVTLIRSTAIDGMLTTIWNSVGYFYDDFDAVLGVFKQLSTKTQVSQLVEKFNQKYKKDLLVWLKGDLWPSDRYSNEQVNQLIQLVKNYKNY